MIPVIVGIISFIFGLFVGFKLLERNCNGQVVYHEGEIYLNITKKDYDCISSGKPVIKLRVLRR